MNTNVMTEVEKKYLQKHEEVLKLVKKLDSKAEIVKELNGKIYISFCKTEEKPSSRCRLYVQKRDNKCYSHLYVGNVTSISKVVFDYLKSTDKKTTWNCTKSEFNIFSESKESLEKLLTDISTAQQKKTAQKKQKTATKKTATKTA